MRLLDGRIASLRVPRALVVAIGTASIVTAANASQGAYFSESWGWVALAFLVPTTVLLLLERVTVPGRLRIAFVAFMCAFTAWIAVSATWSISSAGSLREVERLLVYVAVALALAVILRRGDGPGLLAGLLVGVTLVCGYGLATRLFPNRLDGFVDPNEPFRLSEPLGYYNALGLLAALGLLLALGVTAHARSHRAAVAAGGAAPLLSVTVYLTFSRGAWIALALGLAAMVALEPRRLSLLWSLLVVCPASLAALAFASQQSALTTENASTADVLREGHRLAGALGLLSALSMSLAWLARQAAARAHPSARLARTFDLALAIAVVGGLLAVLVLVGGPGRGMSELKQRFDAEPIWAPDKNSRLFSVSGNGRSDLFRVAWDMARERPLAGTGAGTFEYYWYERRPDQKIRRDGHSLYLETLGELGVVGFLLLGGALATLGLGFIVSRRSRYVSVAAGAYVAWASASALEWHWEMVAVTMTALLAGGIGLVASERGRSRPLGLRARLALSSVVALLSVLAVISLVGNQALFAGREALVRKDWADARDDARRADALLPWSFEPKVVLGDAFAGLGDRQAALRSYRDAVEVDPRNWVVWLRLAQVASGRERTHAYAEVHRLNPREEVLPGEDVPTSG